jgi:cell division transport system permease protein
MKNHLKTAQNHIRRGPYQALAAILIMTITFFVATVLAVLAFSSWNTLHYFETKPQVIAFLKNEATQDQIDILKEDLGKDTRIKDIKYVTKEQALDIYKNATSDNPLLSQLVSPKVFPASIEFSVTDLSYAEPVINEIQGKDVVKEVQFTASLGGTKNIGTVINNLRNISNYVRLGGTIILCFLLTSSLVILLVILGMRISSRRDEIEILQLIGATPGFIRIPFLLEGVFYSLAGAFIGWILASLVVLYLLPSLNSFFGEIDFLPRQGMKLFELFGAILGIEFLIATLLGTTGSLIAIRRYLRI